MSAPRERGSEISGVRKRRMAECHPKRKHYARGLCGRCYNAKGRPQPLTKAGRDSQPGLVRVGIPGWGSLA
jgi:hypothetical protein